MNNYYFLYYFFDNQFIRWIRVAFFISIGIFVYLNFQNPGIILKLLPFYFLLILQELFIHFKLERARPQKNINDDISHAIETVDYKARAILERNNISGAIKEFVKDSSVKYLIGLLDIKFEINHEISEEDLLRKAYTLITRVGGKNIYSLDLFCAYIIVTEEVSKTLFNNGIDEKDIVLLLSWTRKKFGIGSTKAHPLHFTGSGVFDFFIYGWSAELSHYASNFTQEVLSGLHPEPIGRDREYDLLVTALLKSTSSNALIVGPEGVGKSTLVTQMVLDANMGNLPKSLSNKIVFKLYPERLLSGIENQGDLEARLTSLLGELYHAGNIIVYIPNIENIFGGGGLSMDLSGVLTEYLDSSKVKIIGSTTEEAYKEFILTKQGLNSQFDTISMEEPDSQTALFMLLEKANNIERTGRINISFSSIRECYSLSDSYLTDGTVNPGRSIKLLEDAVSYSMSHGERKITKDIIEKFVQEKTKIILSEPTNEESQKLLNLESEIHKSVISQDEAVKAIADAMRRVRSGIKNEDRPIASFLFLGPTGVGKTEAAKSLASSYFGDENSMVRLDMTEYNEPDSAKRLLGSEGKTIVDKIISNPFSEILLDEFEKADPSIHDLFLQILDEGRLTDELGRTVSFKNTIIIATSNAGSEFIRESYKNGNVSGDFKDKLVEKILQENVFKPELVNRFDDVVAFKPLDNKDVVEVVKLFLNELSDELSEKQIKISYDEAVCEFIASNAYSIEFGARNVRRFIEQSVENQLSKLILSHTLSHGDTAKITVGGNNLVIGKLNPIY